MTRNCFKPIRLNRKPTQRLLAQLLTGFFLFLSLSPISPVFAELKLSGYGTIGYVADDVSGTAFVRELVQKPEVKDPATFSSDTRPFLTDSRIGLQAVYLPNDQFELVTQLVFRDQQENTLDESLEWLNLGYLPNENAKLRLGRLGWDGFLMSDHRHLGYAYPWVRPPVEFYGALPMYSLDGADISYKFNTDEAGNTWGVKAQYGKGSTVFPFGGGEYDFESDTWTVSLNHTRRFWNFRLGYSEIDIDSAPPLDTLLAGLSSVSALAPAPFSQEADNLIENMTYEGSLMRFTALGAGYDDGQWVGQSEIGYIQSDADMVTNGKLAYVAIGRRFESLTPFVMLSAFETSSDTYTEQIDWGLLNPASAELQDIAINAINSTRIEQTTFSAGLRWDFDTKAALKLQWDRTDIDANGYGLWWTDADRNRDETVNVITLTLDFVF